MTSPEDTAPEGTKSPFSYSIMLPRFGIKMFSGNIPIAMAALACAANSRYSP